MHRSLAPIAALLLFAPGCGDSKESSEDAGPPPVNQCTSGGDLAIQYGLAAMRDGGIPDGGIPDGGPYPVSFTRALGEFMETNCTGVGKECVDEILAESGVDACLASCFMGTEAETLSLGCAGCYAEIVQCGAQNCVTDCLGGTDEACEQCVIVSCNDRLTLCTGLPAPSLP